MGDERPPQPVLFMVAAFSRYAEALLWARQRLVELCGPVALESPRFAFNETDYYCPTMGPELGKVFFALSEPIDPGRLPGIKRMTNQWERDYAALARHPEGRPLNLDPGYLNLGKLVLASTKDHAHRVYLADGIYGEVTLNYVRGKWQSHDWTFADYRRGDYHQFFGLCRDYLRRRLR